MFQLGFPCAANSSCLSWSGSPSQLATPGVTILSSPLPHSQPGPHMLCGLSSFLFALGSFLPVQPALCSGPGCWLCLPVPPPRPSQPRQARWAPVPGRARGLRCLPGPEGEEGQYLDVQLIHLSPELGGALGDHDGSRRHVNVKGTVTPCGRRRPCSAGRACTDLGVLPGRFP